jgi:cytochrome bd-type quinol oxidase subunit 2
MLIVDAAAARDSLLFSFVSVVLTVPLILGYTYSSIAFSAACRSRKPMSR